MQIDTRSSPFFISNPTGNVTTASITFPVPTLVKPTPTPNPNGDGVIEMGQGGGMSAQGLMIVPYGAGIATNTFSLSCYGWRPTEGQNGQKIVWVAYTLADFTCTLGTVPGVNLGDVNASQLFCGTIVLTVGNANISNEIVSPTGNDAAHILLDAKGSKFIELRFGTGASATSCNALVTRV